MTNESISVVLGVYNQGHILRKTLRVWAMVCLSYRPGSELIICDDGSDDDIEKIVEDFMRSYEKSGLRIAYLRQENEGRPQLAKSLNNSLDYINGKYVLFVMGDSYPRGNILNEYKPYLDDNTVLTGLRENIKDVFNYSVIVPDFRKFQSSFTNIEYSSSPWEGFTGNNFVIPTWMIKEAGGWNEGFRGYGAEDWELAAFVYYRFGAKFVSVSDAVVFHVEHQPRPGSGDPDYYLAKWFEQLKDRYASGNFDRSVKGLKPKEPKKEG